MTKNMLRISSAIVSVAALLTLAAVEGPVGGSYGQKLGDGVKG